MTKSSVRPLVSFLMVSTAAFAIGSSDARAQWGMEGGFFGMRQVPSPQEFINANALVQAGRATMGPVSNNVYANSPNAYFNRVRDNGFSSHYSVNSRRSPGLSTAPRQSANDEVPQAETPTLPRPVLAIGSFFNEARTLVWPSDAPVTGDLMEKRDTSDQACLVVAELVEKHKSAPITTVSEARQKLLDYGQPALREMRAHTTPRIADTFHLFMLSLYDSLAQAAESPAPAASSNSTP